MSACNGRLPPQPSPVPLPEWITRIITPIKAASSEQARTALGYPGGSSGGPSTSQPAAVPGPSGSSPTTESLRHPDPSNSLEELRWRDYQTLQAGGVPPAIAAPAGVTAAALQPAPAAAPAAAAGGLLPGLGAPQGPLPPLGLPLTTPGVATPNTPQFPTPVRTLFPPTPPSGPAIFGGGVAGGDDMDTSASLDVESQFHSMYVRPENAVASPEEMRVVQVESYKLGRQIAPYWLVGGTS